MEPLVQPSVVSLFAGIGGFDLGFGHAGFRIAGHVECDANCRKLLAAKWPDAVALDDVCTAGAHNLPPCDVVTFGFPCQDLSVAGKRAGLAGGRSGLFYQATRIIHELQPAFCLFENVPGLLSSDEGRDFARVLLELDRIGYHGAWRTLDAQWIGVAQRRRRVFGLFSRLDSGAERCAEILSIRESLRGHPPPRRETGEGVAGCLESRTDGGGFPGTDGACAGHVVPTVARSLNAGRDGYNDGSDQTYIPEVARTVSCNAGRGGIPSTDGLDGALIPDVAGCLQERDAKGCDSDTKPGHLVPVRNSGRGYWRDDDTAATLGTEARGVHEGTLAVAFQPRIGRNGRGYSEGAVPALGGADAGATSDMRPCVATPMSVRRLTPTECERLQGFPDGWTDGFSDSVRYRMLGNAVCVRVSEWIAFRLNNSSPSTVV